jgi:putative salt-induced outer membrane protein
MSEFTPEHVPPAAAIRSEKTRNTMLMGALLLSLGYLSVMPVHAQSWDLQTQLELGAVITTGNTEDENIRFKGQFNAARERWSYLFSTEGFRSSKNDELAAQRLYTVGSATYNFDPSDFVETRVAHEDDRFSGYDSQTDFSVSYGQELLRDRSNMTWRYTVGAGMRTSRESGPLGEDFSEAIVRLSTDYTWDLSDNARFIQALGVDIGEESTIARSETAVESDIMSNLSMKFGVKVKHQTEVPIMREKTDTEFAATLLLRF